MQVLKRLMATGIMALSMLAQADPGVTDTKITLGMSAPFSGPNGAYGIDMRQTIQAYFEQVNAGGGINGRKLRLLVEDSKYDPRNAVLADTPIRSASILVLTFSCDHSWVVQMILR